MCTGSSPRAPKAAAPTEPMKDATATMADASSDAARQQAMRRGLASVWTRFPAQSTAAPAAAAASTYKPAPKSSTLGGT